jgi:pimeloyl-ACP methyl ester carboxylesterase
MKLFSSNSLVRKVTRMLMMILGVFLVCAFILGSVLLAHSPGRPQPFLDENGNPLTDSISEKIHVNINGIDQGMFIKGKDIHNPVLLFVHGGPGMPEYWLTQRYPTGLEDIFTVVWWEQRGAGLSYSRDIPPETMTAEQFVADTIEVTNYLRQRFGKEKIYLMAHSWGSYIGIQAAAREPDLYYAYIGNGQMVSTIQDDVMGYELALKYSVERGDAKMVETLQSNGPPPYSGEGMLNKYVTYLDVLNDYMNSPRYTMIVPIIPFVAPEYGLIDKINHTRGLMESFEVVYPQLQDLDFTTQATHLDVPVFIFAGRDDVNAMSSLVEEYFNVLEVPHKELIWLAGGHGLDGENLGQFVEVMVNKVLAQTQSTYK